MTHSGPGRVGQSCCFVGCSRPATHGIYAGTGPDNDTYACAAHVGDLLSDVPDQRVLRLERPDEDAVNLTGPGPVFLRSGFGR